MIKKGAWVRIYNKVLEVSERSPNLPEETKKVPLEMWTKGRLLNDAKIGDEVEVRTIANRVQKGKLIEVNPQYELNYGKLVPELLEIGEKLREKLEESND